MRPRSNQTGEIGECTIAAYLLFHRKVHGCYSRYYHSARQHDFAALADPCLWDCLFRDVRNPVSGKWTTASLIFTRRQPALLAERSSERGMDFTPTMLILTSAASLGCWLSYLQGRWLGNTAWGEAWRSSS
jgi:hypothetical protein